MSYVGTSIFKKSMKPDILCAIKKEYLKIIIKKKTFRFVLSTNFEFFSLFIFIILIIISLKHKFNNVKKF